VELGLKKKWRCKKKKLTLKKDESLAHMIKKGDAKTEKKGAA